MKKTLITLLALSSMASADTLTLYDQWTFDSGTSSTEGRTFATQNATLTNNNGVGLLSINKGGIHLTDDHSLGLSGNWAIQLTMNVPTQNTNAEAGILVGLHNDSAAKGTNVAVCNPADGNVYALSQGTGWGDWGTASRTNLVLDTSGTITLTLMNHDGQLYLAQNKTWATFGGTAESYDTDNDTLGKLTIGFGVNGEGLFPNQTITIHDISVYTFDGSANVSTIKSELMSKAVPEPTTATLSLLALAGLAARRRRR